MLLARLCGFIFPAILFFRVKVGEAQG